MLTACFRFMQVYEPKMANAFVGAIEVKLLHAILLILTIALYTVQSRRLVGMIVIFHSGCL